jgi:hypothetical protein
MKEPLPIRESINCLESLWVLFDLMRKLARYLANLRIEY